MEPLFPMVAAIANTAGLQAPDEMNIQGNLEKTFDEIRQNVSVYKLIFYIL